MPEKCGIDINEKFKTILQWPTKNKLKVNLTNTKERVLQRPNTRNYLTPAELPGIVESDGWEGYYRYSNDGRTSGRSNRTDIRAA